MEIIKNQNEGKVLLRFTANGTMQVANLASSGAETVTGATITQVFFSGSNNWTIARGSNTVITLQGTGHFNLAGHNCPLDQFQSANLVITNPAATPGTLLLEVKKIGTVTYN